MRASDELMLLAPRWAGKARNLFRGSLLKQHAHRRAALECLRAERADAELIGQCDGAVVAMEAAPAVASRCATALPQPWRRAACVVAEAFAQQRPPTAVVEEEATEALSGSGVLAAVKVRDAAR